jgi:hypothetical protein
MKLTFGELDGGGEDTGSGGLGAQGDGYVKESISQVRALWLQADPNDHTA